MRFIKMRGTWMLWDWHRWNRKPKPGRRILFMHGRAK